MKVGIEKNRPLRIVLSVEGFIDSSNADAFYNDVSKFRKEHSKGFLILNFDKVEYITSAGLRALLKLQKEDSNKIIIKNLSNEVMKIMLVSGFDKLFLIERKLQNIRLNDSVVLERINQIVLDKYLQEDEKCLEKIENNLRTVYIDGCELLAKGTKGTVYILEDDKIIKVFSNKVQLSDIIMERNLSKKAFLLGIPTAITYDIVKVNDSYGVIFEMIDADTLSQTINKQPENYDNLIKRYEEILEKMHSTQSNDPAIPSAKKVYINCIEECSKYYNSEELNVMKTLIDSIPDRNTLVHRDYHPNNLMVTNEGMLIIDLADLSKGHPIFDMMSLGLIVSLSKIGPSYMEKIIGLSADKILKLWDDLLHLYFKNKNDNEIKELESQFLFLAKINIALLPVTRPDLDNKTISFLIQDSKENFFKNAKDFNLNINW